MRGRRQACSRSGIQPNWLARSLTAVGEDDINYMLAALDRALSVSAGALAKCLVAVPNGCLENRAIRNPYDGLGSAANLRFIWWQARNMAMFRRGDPSALES